MGIGTKVVSPIAPNVIQHMPLMPGTTSHGKVDLHYFALFPMPNPLGAMVNAHGQGLIRL